MTAKFCIQCGTPFEERYIFGQMRPVCPACGYIHFQDPKVAAVAFVHQDEQVLLIKRGVEPEYGKWSLPGGYVNAAEDPREAAIRETSEETGLDIEIISLIDVIYNPPIHQRNNHHPKMKITPIVIIYEGQVTGGTLRALDDAEDVGWFGPDDLPDMAFASTHRVIDLWLKKHIED